MQRSTVLMVVVVVAILIWVGYSQASTGFRESTTISTETTDSQNVKTITQTYQRTLWDWLQLLIIPTVLVSAAWWLNRSERDYEMYVAERRAETDHEIADRRIESEHKIADERLQEATFDTYLDKMTELLLDKGLRTSADTEARAVARTRTLTVLRRLDKARKVLVVKFLYESGLIIAVTDATDPCVIKLSGANLREIDLNETFLSSVCLSGADLSKAHLSKTDLRKADLSGTLLFKADLSEANLSGAILWDAHFDEANLTRTSLEEANLSSATMIEATVVEANLRGAKLERAYLRFADLTRADLSSAVLRRAYLPDATLVESTFDWADLSDAMLIDANLSGAKLLSADLHNANLSGADLCDADLCNANLHGASLSEAVYDDATKWPDGFDPVAAGAKKVEPKPPDETSSNENKPGSATR